MTTQHLESARQLYREFDLGANVRDIDGYRVFLVVAVIGYLCVGAPLKYAFSTSMINAALLSGVMGLFFSISQFIDLFLKNPFDSTRPFHVASHDEWMERIERRALTPVIPSNDILDEVKPREDLPAGQKLPRTFKVVE